MVILRSATCSFLRPVKQPQSQLEYDYFHTYFCNFFRHAYHTSFWIYTRAVRLLPSYTPSTYIASLPPFSIVAVVSTTSLPAALSSTTAPAVAYWSIWARPGSNVRIETVDWIGSACSPTQSWLDNGHRQQHHNTLHSG